MDFNSVADHRAPGQRRGLRARAGVAAGALLLAGSIAGWTAGTSGAGSVAATPVSPVPTAADRVIGAGGDSYAGIVDTISPAVVTIRSERKVRNISQDGPQIPDELRDFFGFGDQPGRRGPGQRQAPERREGGLGSGVIVRADGYILTNNHVVDKADQVTVELTDGRTLKAKVVGTDAPSDLAVLKVDGKNLQTLDLGDSDAVRVGDVVLAVGNPLGVGQTVTMGIVSAKGRSTGGSGDGGFEDFIQTDAPINQGNSGGALVSTRGQLIGINSQILSQSGGNIGIGFAIPANMARNVMTQLIDNGAVRRGMLGVTIQPVTSDIARSLGLTEVRGALVNAVNAGSAAEKGGVKRGDVITAIGGEAVKDGNTLRNHVAQMAPGSTVKLTILRGGKEQVLNVTLSELKAADAVDDERGGAADGTGFGLTVEPLSAEQARTLGVKGVVITGVQPSGRAAEAGLRSGDVIEEVDGKAVESVDAFRTALKAGDRPALLLVHRSGATLFVTVDRVQK
jgi:serine protease Do